MARITLLDAQQLAWRLTTWHFATQIPVMARNATENVADTEYLSLDRNSRVGDRGFWNDNCW